MFAFSRRYWWILALAASLGAAALSYAAWFRTTPPHTIVFVVLDTVRAASTSLCGYERPTTPILGSLRERGASVSCRAYAPGSWTLPSHVSYFTGLTVPEHQVLRLEPMSDTVPTLAEALRDRGYQTALVSGNPVLSARLGIQRGFDTSAAAKGLPGWRGERLLQAVGDVVERTSLDEPLFLFVNIMDAHDPYPAIPPDVDWVGPQPLLRLGGLRKPASLIRRFHAGALGEAERTAKLRGIRNGYDYGIYSADASLGRILALLRRTGRLDRPYRVVVTSDHGELLGEHDRLRHGGHVYEGNARVPLLFFDSSRRVELVEPISALVSYSLVLDGRVDARLTEAKAVSMKWREFPSQAMAATWQPPATKDTWGTEQWHRVDLATDPDELHPAARSEDEVDEGFRTYVEDFRALLWDDGSDLDPDLAEELGVLGYIE